jgi:DNA-binding transcriptional MerR regulator
VRKTNKDYLKTAEVARILGVSTQTLYNWLRLGKIAEPERHPLTSYRLWTLKDVEMIPKTREAAK